MGNKRGRKPVGEVAMSAAERMRKHREAKAISAALTQQPLRNEAADTSGEDYAAALNKLLATLPKTDQDHLLKGYKLIAFMYKRAANAEREKVYAERAELEAERRKVRAKIDEQFKDEQARLDQAQAAALAEATRYRLLCSEVDSHMTREDYKFVRSCLHSDKHPAAELEKWDKAFLIFRQLEKWVDAKQPLDELRSKGWETISKRFKPKRA